MSGNAASPSRHDELQLSLRSELDDQAQRNSFGPRERVAWLVEQLENYVARWLGISVAMSRSVPATDNDLFLMVWICADVITEQLDRIQSTEFLVRWNDFRGMLGAVRNGSADADPQQFASAMKTLRSTLR